MGVGVGAAAAMGAAAAPVSVAAETPRATKSASKTRHLKSQKLRTWLRSSSNLPRQLAACRRPRLLGNRSKEEKGEEEKEEENIAPFHPRSRVNPPPCSSNFSRG